MSAELPTAALAEPRPGKLLVALSVVVIGGCLFISGLLTAAIFQTWDVCAVASGVLLGPVPLALMGLQYSAVFRNKAVASQLAAVTLGMFGLFGAGSFAIEVANRFMQGEMDGADLWRAAQFGSLCLLLPCLIFLATAWQDWRWARSLALQAASHAAASHSANRWIAPAVAGIIVLTLGWTITVFAPPYAEHVGPEQAPRRLPKNASDVSYCTTSRGSERIEFTIDEPGFRQWVDDVVVHIQSTANGDEFPTAEITDLIRVNRYNGVLGRSPEPDPPTSIEVRMGLVYRWNYTDHNVVAFYDRTTRRAYLSVDWY